MNEKEKQLLAKMHKAFGSPEVKPSVFESNDESRLKEKLILEKMEKVLNKSPVERIIEPEPIKLPEAVQESFVDLATATTRIITQPTYQVPEPQPQLPDDFVTKSMAALSKTAKVTSAPEADDINPILRKELDLMKKTMVDLHSFASRISQLGGGGAGSIEDLTFHTTSVTSSNYQIGRKDYYIGVNYPGPVSISLPIQNVKEGRQVVVKDESGLCSVNNITISGISIDNDTQAILAINNGSLTFIYSRGWRII